MKAIDGIRKAAEFLKGAGVEYPEKEAAALVTSSLNADLVEIYRDNPELTPEQAGSLRHILQKRLRREPLQYVTGNVEFLGLNLLVGRGVLIPRPETEFMAEHVIKTVNSRQSTVNSKKILDLCTGSGCLALALACEFPESAVLGIDISESSLEYARRNAELNGIKNVTFLQGDLFKPLEKLPVFDLIVSNPPYIKKGDIEDLQPEVRFWEPRVALDGGKDGLDFYRKIIPAAGDFLRNGGRIALELGKGQSGAVADILKSSGYVETEEIKDCSGIERVILATCRRL